ncbi:MAG TPA: cytochrome b N-terminal domain-containing protein [Kofleriaceae bacterium]|nr:cytochrome b N-terminal domain-containing protein [Kofleriaceae bacterium]
MSTNAKTRPHLVEIAADATASRGEPGKLSAVSDDHAPRGDGRGAPAASPPARWAERARAYLGARGVSRGDTPAMLPDGASFARVFGAVLVFLFAVEAITGVGLAAFYAPSSTDAWASVTYVQDQVSLGWLVRGLHFHAASAIVIVAGAHLLQTAIVGAYKKPRELVWWLGILLLMLTLAWAVTGYVLRWDQAGFWANKVEVGIAAATPVIGAWIKSLALGGNDYGNLTLTRFYALHVLILPVIVIGLIALHIQLSRAVGATPISSAPAAPEPRWPAQSARDAIAIALVFAILLVYVIQAGGADLAAPADPSSAYDARPLWYFRWLFEIRELAGSAEKLAALATPAIVAGALVALPLVDRGPSRAPRERVAFIGGVVGLLAVIGGLTAASLAGDGGDAELAKREAQAAKRAALARKLAKDNGVPATGGTDVFLTSPMARGRMVFEAQCASCHAADSKERKGPVIGPGHGDRAWLKHMIVDPSNDALWGRTKLAKSQSAMKPFAELAADELAAVVELMYGETGAKDVDQARAKRGKDVFEKACSDCHALDEDTAGASGPGLAGIGSRTFYFNFMGNPMSPLHMGKDNSEMPRFDHDLSVTERDAVAEYLVWLRTATPDDVARLDPW